ncbi:hypothetical protein GOP47_0028368 [Adiantum capillus-veneris]|nr:hypothetical protein GOP47_0028368 [Adiantum capillus-veneris]
MRKLVEPPLGRLGIIADSIHYTGYLEDDNDVLSDISFYAYGDDGTEDEVDVCHSMKKTVDRFTPRDVKNFKLARKSVNRVRDSEEQVLKKTQKGRKSRIETSDEQSTSGTDAESDQDVCEKTYSLVRRQKKSSKLRDDASSFDDSEGDVTVQRSKKFLETRPKRRGSGPVYTESDSGSRGEKVSDSKIKEEYLLDSIDVREADAVVGGAAVQAFQRRKKLCKAADLNAAREKVSKENTKGYLEMKLKTGKKGYLKSKDHSAMKGIHTNRLEDNSSDLETSPKTCSRKSSKKVLVKEETLSKDDVGLVRAEFSGEGNSTAVMGKSPSSTGHTVKHREMKHERFSGSISAGKWEGSNQRLVVRSTKKASKDFCVSLDSMVDHQRHAVEKVCDNGVAGEEVSSGVTEGAEGNQECIPDKNGNANVAITKVGWVMCDSCKKWRCIPASLIDVIESTNCRWFCNDNPDKRFANCSIPQEKTNKEINRELNLSEVSFCEEGDEKHPEIDSKSINGLEHQSQPSTWTLIKHNIFQHRGRKSETLDEQMVCTCKPPDDGSLGCGDDCHNRMLNIECVSQTCPCGDACSNQQFQRRSYKKVNRFRCGKKGFGLQVLEDVSKGAFIIEYVGEVLDVAAYEARQKQYALEGQKHFYFMTLSGSEIIDACYKGNLGRFINHSCEPNCTTEKWMVNGEVCIGLFAIRDLEKGEEITFDYNFVRLCGAAAKKCLCGSRDCRGFIGGDPTTPQSVVQSDSDEDDPEPIMIEESSEDESRIEDSKIVTHRKRVEKIEANPPLELRSKEKNWMHNEASERLDASSKQAKIKASIKAPVSANVKKLTIEIYGGHFEGVEEELNKLIDENGGLCKGQPEVATSYLKLLVRTAFSSSDTSSGEGSRSTRDLSLVLDALLKTQSRAILLEVLSRNGSQIMHKIVKQSRMDYKRTPIIRKILKVLEFLAVRRILTIEQINAEPTRSGAESIKDAIFQLCRHPDTEVQNMARHFEGKYFKSSSQKPLRRGQRLSSDLSKWRLFPKQTQQAISGAVAASEDEPTRKRRRPNRWDQPSQEVLDTTLAGGLPQSFWPFNANNLLAGGHQSNGSNQCIRQIESAAADELGAMHPGPPSFPAVDNTEAAHIATGVVSGIPVEQLRTSSTMGYISQQGICIGIPVSQFQGGGTPGLDFPYMPQTSTNIPKANHPLVGQTSPFRSNVDAQESQQQHELEMESTGKVGEELKVTFGISHSQFFQQMHGIFGSAFHPWQLQALMAPHAWGPFMSGDARIRDLGFVNDTGKQSNEYHASEGTSNIPVEPSVARGYRQEAEPLAPVLSPPLHPPPPPPPSRPFTYPSPSVQAPKRMNTRPYIGNNDPERSNVPYQQLKSSCWKPQNWNTPRWPKFPGGNKYRNPGFRREFSHTQRFNRQNFVRQGQGPPRSNTKWEESSSWRQSDKNWGSFHAQGVTHEESMEVEGVGGCNEPYGHSFQYSANPSGSMPLERPWGYKEEYHNEDCSNYSGEFPQERVHNTSTSWGVHN